MSVPKDSTEEKDRGPEIRQSVTPPQGADSFRVAELVVKAFTAMLWPLVALIAVLYFGSEIKGAIHRSDKQTVKLGEAEISLEDTKTQAAQLLGAATVQRLNRPDSEEKGTFATKASPRLNSTQTSLVVDQTFTAPKLARYAGKKLLWVDDHPENNEYVSQLFGSLNIIVETSTSTDDALSKLAKTDYAVVITDMRRGVEDTAGYDLLAKIRRRNYKIPVVIYSASSNPAFQQEAKQRGAFGETNDPTELVSLVTTAILQKE